MTTSTKRDELTGALSREALMNCLRSESPDEAHECLGQILACTDIENFKKFNAYNGHAVGDVVLRRVVAHVETVLGRDNRLFRHGGLFAFRSM